MTPLNETTVSDAAKRYIGAGFAIAAWTNADGKAPRYPGWDKNPVTAALDTDNIGLIHGINRTLVIDVDDKPLTQKLFMELFGIDLEQLVLRYPSYHGNPERVKLLFRVPHDFTGDLAVVKLNFPDKKKGEVLSLRGSTGAKISATQDLIPPSLWNNETGQRYQWITQPQTLEQLVEAPAWLMELWTNWKSYEDHMKTICGFQTAPLPERQHRAQSYSSDGEDIIELFNQRTTIRELILPHGYQETRQKNRYQHPGSSSGTPGTVVLQDEGKEVVFSHGSDIIGESGKASDAFGVFTLLNHGGDAKAAYKEAAELLGLSYAQTRPQQPQHEYTPPETIYDDPQPVHDPVNPPPPKKTLDFASMGISTEDLVERVNRKFYIDGIIQEKTHVVLFGNSGTGKTTIGFYLMSEIIRTNPNVKIFYFLLDGADQIALNARNFMPDPRMTIIMDANASEIMESIHHKVKAKESQQDTIYVFDTYKKFQNDVNNKKLNTQHLDLIRKITSLGATCVSIAHTNKDGGTFSGNAEIEQDTDGVIRFDRLEDAQNKEMMTVSLTAGARVRWRFIERSFRLPTSNPDPRLVEPIEYTDISKWQGEKEDMREIAIIKTVIAHVTNPGGIAQTDLVNRLNKEEMMGLNTARELLIKYAGRHWARSRRTTVGGRTYNYTILEAQNQPD